MMKALLPRPRRAPSLRTVRYALPLIQHIGGTASGVTVTWTKPDLSRTGDGVVQWRCEMRETPTAPGAVPMQRDAGTGPAPAAARAMRWLTTSLLTVSAELPAESAEALTDWNGDPLIRDALLLALDRYKLAVSVEVIHDHGVLTWTVEPVLVTPHPAVGPAGRTAPRSGRGTGTPRATAASCTTCPSP